MVKLTAMEIAILNAMRDNEYQDSLTDGGTWSFTVIDNSGIPGKQASGVISSLVQKGLIECTAGNKKLGDDDTIYFTDAGKALFDDADGEECQWGGPKLLKELPMDDKEPSAVTNEETVSGITVKDLAAIMGIDEKAVRRKLRKAGLKRNGRVWSLTESEAKALK